MKISKLLFLMSSMLLISGCSNATDNNKPVSEDLALELTFDKH